MNLEFYRGTLTEHGYGATLYHAAYRAANRITRLALWDAIALTPGQLDPAIGSDVRVSRAKMLGAGEMRRYLRDPENGLTEEFLADAAARGDRCLVFTEGEALASYAWYTERPTHLPEVSRDLILHFDPRYAYVYNGFTRPVNRGQRLHGLGMAAGLAICRSEGRAGLLGYVDSSNFASLKSCRRLGYHTFGFVLLVKAGPSYLCSATPGCRAYGFRVEQQARVS